MSHTQLEVLNCEIDMPTNPSVTRKSRLNSKFGMFRQPRRWRATATRRRAWAESLEPRYLLTSITGTVNGYAVSIDRHDAPGELIAADTETWVLAHGNDSAPTTSYIDELASAIHVASGGDQVLTLDWSSIAALFIGTTESQIIPVAQWASQALTSYGFSSADLNLVGHSFGAYVVAETAERIAGGVNTLVGLDPAADVPFFSYNPNSAGQIDFAGNSSFSWTFSDAGGSLGSSTTPASADEAITVQNSGHSPVVTLFSNMLSAVGNPDVHQDFTLSRLVSHTPGPWQINQYSNGGTFTGSGSYEAVITADATGVVAQSIEYVPLVTPPSVSVVTPNGGESWSVGSTQEILWSATDESGVTSVDISFSSTGSGGPFTPIATGEANDGSFNWLVPDSPTNDAYIRVVAHDTDGNSAADESDGAFSVFAPDTEAPNVSLTSPNGGEDWAAGSTQSILWSASDNVGVDSIQLEYSINGGATFNPIAVGEPDDGVYLWNVPNVTTSDAVVRVVAYDATGNSAADQSSEVFTISSPPAVVKDYANSDFSITGSPTGTFAATTSLDGTYQQIQEEAYSNSRSRLEHKWVFNVTGGSDVSFYLQGYQESNDNDDIVFAYSSDDANYTDMLTMTSTEQLYSATLPNDTSGVIYVRAMDSNRGRRNNGSLDSVFVDEMYFLSTNGPVLPVTDIAVTSISAPSAVSESDVVTIDVTLQNVGNQDVNSDIVVTLAYDDASLIGSATVNGGLSEGVSAVVPFEWDTSGVPLGDRVLTASHNFADDVSSNDQANATIEIQDVQPPTEFVVDDGDVGYDASGWSSKSNADAYGGDYDYARPGNALVASWTFPGLAAGTYDVFATWVAHPKRHATNANFVLYDGVGAPANELASMTVNQTQSPGADGWQLLGAHNVTSGTLTVNLESDTADGLVIADAVRVVPSGISAAQAAAAFARDSLVDHEFPVTISAKDTSPSEALPPAPVSVSNYVEPERRKISWLTERFLEWSNDAATSGSRDAVWEAFDSDFVAEANADKLAAILTPKS